MARSIILCGASSVGKTTLATDWCREHKTYDHIREVARDVMRQRSINQQDLKQSLKTDKKLFLDLQFLILEEQDRREVALEERPFISDRGPDPLVYVRQCVSQETATTMERSQIAKATFQRYRSQRCLLVVLSPLPVEPKDDGVRLVPSIEQQKEFTNLLRGLLREHSIPYIYISETGRRQRLNLLEKATNGEFPFEPANPDDFPPNIPFFLTHKSLSQLTVSIRSVEFTQDRIIIRLSQPFSRGQTNRMVDLYGAECFLSVGFHQKVSPDVIQKVLLGGLLVNGEEYHFLGCSSSGLKDRKCYMFHGTVEAIHRVLEECGNFSAINSVSKRLKRIGLLFSAAWPTHVKVPEENAMPLIEDIETPNGGNFTDGCGAIGTELAKSVMEGARPQLELGDYLPSVFQIRYQGCKGVVVRDGHPSVKPNCLLIRKSMEKFKPGRKPLDKVWLCDHSRPYSYGHLNKQFIMLFSALGIEDGVFLQKQEEHLERVVRMTEDPSMAIEMLRWSNQPASAAKVAQCPTQVAFKAAKHLQQELHRLQSKFAEKMSKLSIPILESRTIFGVCDPCGVLKYGECFVRPTVNGKPMTIQGKVTVAKNPCYLLGDVRLLTAVADERTHDLEHLVDCIVFPTQGKRPHPVEIAGSDLDGDQYFVTWDVDLLVPHPQEPYDYPSVEAYTSTKVTREKMVDYFARYRSNMGQIDTYYKSWAEEKGVGSIECQELGKLFARSVDAAKTGDTVPIPPNLKPRSTTRDVAHEEKSESLSLPEPVWKMMEQNAEEKKQELKLKLVTNTTECSAVTEEFVWSVLLEKGLSMSEFQYFQFIQHWCSGQTYSNEEEEVAKLRELSILINFGEFTVEQQVAAIDAGIPRAMVTNDLNKSNLLESAMLDHFSLLSPHCGWRFYLHSNCADLDWQQFFRAVQHYPESLLVLQLPDGVRFILHFLTQLQPGETHLDAGSVVAYLFSPSFNLKLRHVLGEQYYVHLDTDNDLLQLYRNNKKEQSLLWLKRESQVKKRQSTRDTTYDRVSIDLLSFKRNIFRDTQHPKINKQNFQSVEVFVRNFHHEPAFFDILVADQPDFFVPEEIIEPEELEEVPSEEEEDEVDTTGLDASTPSAAALSALQEAALKGKCYWFYKVLQVLSGKGASCELDFGAVEKALEGLLRSVVTRHACKQLSSHLEESLQMTVTLLYLQGFLHSPHSCLHLLGSLSQLHCTSLVDQMATLLLPTLSLSHVSDYLDVLHQWQLWFFLPSNVAYQMVLRLYTLCQLLLSEEGESKSGGLEHHSQHLASSKEVNPAVDSQVNQYTCHFAYLLLRHLLEEAPQTEVQDTDRTLVRMKVYDFKDPHQLAGSDSHTEGLHDDKHAYSDGRTWRAGFNRSQGVSSRKFTVGAYVTISIMTQDPTTPEKIVPLCVALGQVAQVSYHPANVVVDVQGPVPTGLRRSAELSKGHWQLGIVGNVTAFKRAMKALHVITKKPTELVSLLVHSSSFQLRSDVQHSDRNLAVIPGDTTTATPFPVTVSAQAEDAGISASANVVHSGSFNPSQQQAIAAALSQRLTLIHGPPGTGKTRVACEIVRCVCQQLAGKKMSCVLAVAETNMAADNLTRCLLQLNLRVVRVGSQGQVSVDVRHVTLEQQIETKRVEEMKAKQRSPFPNKKIAKEILHFAEVVTTTCTGAGDPVLEGMNFPFVVIDEATQVMEPISLIPISHQCQQLTLIGDPQQLPPTIPGSRRTPLQVGVTEDGPSLNQLSVTLFHRLQQVCKSFFLEEQHRMHPGIAQFPSEAFYDGKLKSAEAVLARSPLELVCFQQEEHHWPLIFIDVSLEEHHVGSSIENTIEAEMVVEVVKFLLNHEVCMQEIAVLTPYSGQVWCIHHKLTNVPSQVIVATVDSFQGREKDVIIFSTVRCNPGGTLGFTDDRHRMNVLLTRARRGVIGIGCQKTLCNSELWAKWLQQVQVWTAETFREVTGSESKKGIGRQRRGGGGRFRGEGLEPHHQHHSTHWQQEGHQRRPQGRGSSYQQRQRSSGDRQLGQWLREEQHGSRHPTDRASHHSRGSQHGQQGVNHRRRRPRGNSSVDVEHSQSQGQQVGTEKEE